MTKLSEMAGIRYKHVLLLIEKLEVIQTLKRSSHKVLAETLGVGKALWWP